MPPLYADILLPLPTSDTYTYLIPDSMSGRLQVGMRVVVPFGKRRYYTGIIRELHRRPPAKNYALKSIFVAPDDTSLVLPSQLRFWAWMASYYLCSEGEVYKAALPAGLQPDSETVVSLCNDFEATDRLSQKAQATLDALATFSKPPTVAELERRSGQRNLLPTLTTLVNEGAVRVNEEVKAGIAPPRETFVHLSPHYPHEKSLQPLFETLRRATGQERLLLHFLESARPFEADGRKELPRRELLQASGSSAALLNALVRRGALELVERTVQPPPMFPAHPTRPARTLTPAQLAAYEAVRTSFSPTPSASYTVPRLQERQKFSFTSSSTLCARAARRFTSFPRLR